jgi:hypothetical protein
MKLNKTEKGIIYTGKFGKDYLIGVGWKKSVDDWVKTVINFFNENYGELSKNSIEMYLENGGKEIDETKRDILCDIFLAN